jgi:hypothetical protein
LAGLVATSGKGSVAKDLGSCVVPGRRMRGSPPERERANCKVAQIHLMQYEMEISET